jgi:hypothetical protein
MIDYGVLHSLPDHLKTGTCDLDHPVVCWCRKYRKLARQVGVIVTCFLSGHSDGSLICTHHLHRR